MHVEWFMVALTAISFSVVVGSVFVLQQSQRALKEAKRLNTESRIICRKTEMLVREIKTSRFKHWLNRWGLRF